MLLSIVLRIIRWLRRIFKTFGKGFARGTIAIMVICAYVTMRVVNTVPSVVDRITMRWSSVLIPMVFVLLGLLATCILVLSLARLLAMY